MSIIIHEAIPAVKENKTVIWENKTGHWFALNNVSRVYTLRQGRKPCAFTASML
jgi:hypothetical protein